jgi:hypothetical protein
MLRAAHGSAERGRRVGVQSEPNRQGVNGFLEQTTPAVPEQSVLAAEYQYLGKGQCLRVGDGQERGSATNFRKPQRCAAVKPQLRWTGLPEHFDIAPQHTARKACPQCLHGCLLRGESCREMHGRRGALRAVGNLAVGEHPLYEAIAMAFDRAGDPVDIRGIKAEAENLRHVRKPLSDGVTGVSYE